MFLLLTIVLYGLATELFCALHPDIDNFWHAQATVMLADKRLPVYIICLCKYNVIHTKDQKTILARDTLHWSPLRHLILKRRIFHPIQKH